MSLQVWLPLTRDVRNQGVCGGTLTTSGVTFADGGKLGGKYLSGGTITIPAATCAKFFNKNHMSFAFWLYPIGSSSSSIIMGQDSMAAGDNRMYSIFQYNTPNDLHLSWQDETSSGTFLGSVDAGFFAADTWTHCCITYDGSAAKVYKNGTLVATHSGTSNRAVFNHAYPIRGSSIRKLQDVRIYDHVLSLTEIKRLAQGLVLHYPLDRGGFGNENLLSRYVVPGQAGPTSTAAGGRTTWLGDYKITIPATENADTYFRLFMSEQLVSGQTYTISCQVDGLLSGSVYRFPMFAQNNTAMGVLNLDHNGLNSLTFTMNWTGTQTAATGANGETVYVNFLDDAGRTIVSGQGAITVSNFKLEKGEKVTPWCPNILDTLYSTMGLNSSIEYDCSGYCNNGTRSGTFNWTSDKPKYGCSMIFNGTNNTIQTPDLTTMVTDKNYTIACWFYKDSIGSKNYQTIYGGPSGFELEARNSGGTDPQLVGWNWGKPVASYTFGVWHHFAFVHTDSDCKIYLDGEYVSTGSSASIPSGNYFIGAWRDTSSQNYEGKISDFRIYATALSASDIRSLYQNN